MGSTVRSLITEVDLKESSVWNLGNLAQINKRSVNFRFASGLVILNDYRLMPVGSAI